MTINLNVLLNKPIKNIKFINHDKLYHYLQITFCNGEQYVIESAKASPLSLLPYNDHIFAFVIPMEKENGCKVYLDTLATKYDLAFELSDIKSITQTKSQLEPIKMNKQYVIAVVNVDEFGVTSYQVKPIIYTNEITVKDKMSRLASINIGTKYVYFEIKESVIASPPVLDWS